MPYLFEPNANKWLGADHRLGEHPGARDLSPRALRVENRGDPPTASAQTIAAWQINQTDQHDIISGSETLLLAIQPQE
jgi:hypothetical protein